MAVAEIIMRTSATAATHWERFRLLPTGVEVVDNPTFEEWVDAFADLTRVQGSIQWWLGDMLQIGEARYGEKYAQVAEATGHSAQTLMNYVWVASSVAPERRRPALSFSAHKEVAALEPEEQEAVLSQAEKSGLTSSKQIGEIVRTYRRELKAPEADNLSARRDSSPAEEPAGIPNNLSTRQSLESGLWQSGPADKGEEPEEHEPEESVADVLGREIELLQEEVAALTIDDKDAKLREQVQKIAQWRALSEQKDVTIAELKKTASYGTNKLAEIRKALGVESDRQILPTIRGLMRRAAA